MLSSTEFVNNLQNLVSKTINSFIGKNLVDEISSRKGTAGKSSYSPFSVSHFKANKIADLVNRNCTSLVLSDHMEDR